MVAEHLGMMFPAELEAPACEWDERFEYKCMDLVVYFQTHAMVAFKTGDEWATWVRMVKAARGELHDVTAELASKRLRCDLSACTPSCFDSLCVGEHLFLLLFHLTHHMARQFSWTHASANDLQTS